MMFCHKHEQVADILITFKRSWYFVFLCKYSLYLNTDSLLDLHVDLQPLAPSCALLKPDLCEGEIPHWNVDIPWNFPHQVTFQKWSLFYSEIRVTFSAFDTSVLFYNCI